MAKTITQFNVMRPDKPQWTDGNHIQYLENVDPLYYLYDHTNDGSGRPSFGNTIEMQNYPLTPCRNFQSLSVANGNNTVQYMISANMTNFPFDVYTSWNDGRVYGTRIGTLADGTIQTTTHTLQGTVFAAAYPDSQIFAFTDKLIGVASNRTSSSAGGLISYTTVTALGSAAVWTTYPVNVVTNPFYFISNPASALFLDKIWFADAYTRNTMSAIRGFNKAGGTIVQDTSLVLNIPDYYSILRLVNYKNRYLVAAAAYDSYSAGLGVSIGDGSSPNGNALFFFSGSTKGYQYSIPLPGMFIDMVMVGDSLKVLIQRSVSRYSIYHVSGDKLVYEEDIQFTVPQIKTTPQWRPLIEINGMLGVVMDTNGIGGIYIIGNDEIPVKYVLRPSIFNGYISNTQNNRLYGFYGNNISVQKIVGTDFGVMAVRTNWADVDTKLTSVDIWYDTPPQIAGDAFSTTLYTWSEEQGRSGASLNDIRYLSSITRYNTLTKTTLDCKGLVADKVQLYIQAYTGGGTWRPIIRKIQINESKQ